MVCSSPTIDSSMVPLEDDGLATGGRRKGGTKRDRSLGRHFDVFETVDGDGFMVGATDNEKGRNKKCEQSKLTSHINLTRS
jgi:hypothetical protein